MSFPQLVWYKRDLRVADHRPLAEAAKKGPVCALYVYEDEILRLPETSSFHFAFINECLGELRTSLQRMGTNLLLRRGEITAVLERLHQSVGFESIWCHEETGGDVTYRRDIRVQNWCRGAGIALYEFPQFGVVRPLKTRDGWSAQWHRRMNESPVRPPKRVTGINVPDFGDLIGLAELGLAPLCDPGLQQGGEVNAQKNLVSFLKTRGRTYQKDMSSPQSAWEHCSRLSPYLAYGAISMRTVYQTTKSRRLELKQDRASGKRVEPGWMGSLASFEKRLRWHCHFMQKLEDEPDLEFNNMSRLYDGLRPEQGNKSYLEAWAHGQTGYPFIDACMRSLRARGWINFRMRAMLVSFASYHLWLHWRPTAIQLARHFVDFEPGIHFPQVQMQSGTTGINAVRIYSPIKQAQDQDPDGHFIRQWVPELAGVPCQNLVEPHRMSLEKQHQSGVVIGKHYPAPLVEHLPAVRAAKQKIFSLRKSPAARAEAKRVYQRHGSRKRRTGRPTKERSRRGDVPQG